MATKITEPTAQIPSSEELEKAFNQVVTKLRQFSKDLPEDERLAFMELIDSAKAHSDYVQARNEGDLKKIIYEKPIQVHATLAMKQKMRGLSKLFRK